MNPSSFSFVFLISLFTLFSSTSVSSSTSLSYSHHCASMVPESTPTDSDTTIVPYHRQFLSHYTGGDRIFNNNISSKFSLESKKYFWFLPTGDNFETNTTGVYKIKAYLHLIHSNFAMQKRNYSELKFAFDGFWSLYSGKLCMVGSGSWYSNEGNLINLDAVLKLNYAINLTIFSSLVTGKLESLASPTDTNYFEPVSLLEYGTSSNYQFSLVSGEFDRDCCGGNDFPKNQSLGLNPGLFCSTMNRMRITVFDLEYLNECSSSNNCTPLGTNDLPSYMSLQPIHCSEEEHKVQYGIIFGPPYPPFDPSTTLVGEGSWDEKKNQICIVACRFLNSTDSLDNTQVGDCSIRLSLRYPAFWTIRNRTSILGQIWTNKTANESGYFNRITFRSRDNRVLVVPGLRYEYTVTEKVRKLCPVDKTVTKKGDRYPKAKSKDMAFDMMLKDSAGNRASWTKAMPSSFGDQFYAPNSFYIPTSRNDDKAEFEEKTTYHGPLNISYTISPYRTSSAFSVTPGSKSDIAAEGLYDEKTGSLCMIGCRKMSAGESMDCELLLKFHFPPVNSKEGGRITGSVKSMRAETDLLYFKELKVTTISLYRATAKRSVWRMDLEIVMVLISNTIACVFVGSQLFYAKKNPQVLPFASLLMLVILTLGHMVPLVLNFEALFRGSRKENNVLLLGSSGWLEVNEVVVRAVTMVAFLLQFRLLQRVFSARLRDENRRVLWVAEMKALFVSTTLYILGLLFVLFLNARKQNHIKATVSSTSVFHYTHSLWGDLISYSGLVLDGFLLPQILLNIFQISKEKTLSHSFYIGTTCVRLLPHAYDLYRAHNYARTQFDGAYIFANPNVDFYSRAWDVVISCGGVLFAIVIYLQQRFGGRYILGRRFWEVEVYEMVPVTSSDQ
ncbi:hypothetical protein Vadar_033943 [Vaccinium darrowii]|uniref:Uncharacterized protein n=1 Tax=Vaccinium darrowii TaxID=229202 RepID=A0ACB7XWT0_9ERIC|nr:hypothetical protein Vadar_033943 [Vaccinium darrowii]